MRQKLIEILACPTCRSFPLRVDAFVEDGDEIMAGTLMCSACSRVFPVIAGVPRLLPDSLLGTLRQYHPEFFDRYNVPLPPEPASGPIARTLAFFTRQRPELFDAQSQPELSDYLKKSLELRLPEAPQLAGRFGLDAGCGEGRYAQLLTGYGAEVVGLDLGNSVDYAYRRNRGNPRAHIVQGSIYQPPFRPEVFDFVASVGVLHHLPDPRGGFDALVPLLAPGGSIYVWVYGLEDMSLIYRLSHLTFLRGVTRLLPPAATYLLSVPIAVALEAGLFLPARLAAAVAPGRIDPQLRELSELPFSVIVAEVHDRIGAPVTHFLTERELREWYAGAGLTASAVSKTPGGRGWAARGRSAVQSLREATS